LPNLLKDIKALQFNPELFSFYTQNINNKRSQQEVLYKKVREDDRHFTRLLNRENKRIEVRVQEMKSIQEQILECQKEIKIVREKYENLQSKIRGHEDEMNEKIDEEIKLLKEIKNKNSFLEADYNSTKKDLENVIVETKEKHKIGQDKLALAQKSVKSMTQQIKRKTELLKNLNNPQMLVPIKSEENALTTKKSKKVTNKKELTINKNNETNGNRMNTISTNENLQTMASGSGDAQSEIRKTTIRKKKK
jgi:chromosome segregation ATPase